MGMQDSEGPVVIKDQKFLGMQIVKNNICSF